jgi:DNA-binding HxlR family transcriptional regulator
MYKRKTPIELNCGLDLVREVLNGKWKIHLLYFISEGAKRPGDLQRKIPRATRRVLNVQLNELEKHGLISRTIYAELPPRVEYENRVRTNRAAANNCVGKMGRRSSESFA